MADFVDFRIVKGIIPLDTQGSRWKWSAKLEYWEENPPPEGKTGHWGNWRPAWYVIGWSYKNKVGTARSREKAHKKLHDAEAALRELAVRHNALAIRQETDSYKETGRL